MDKIVIEQSDRDLATHIVSICRGFGVNLPDDGHFAIQAAARHRLAERERAAKVAENMRAPRGVPPCDYDMACDDIAAAIRAGDEK